MKTIRVFSFLSGIILSSGAIKAVQSVFTPTFVNPCQPFGVINALPNTYGCYSYSATNAGNFDPNAYYSWNFGDGVTVNGTSVYHCYNTVTVATIYSVTVSYISPMLCGPLPTQQTYTLLLNPPAQQTCVHNPPSYSLSANSVTICTGVAIPEIMYSLNFGDGTPASNLITHHYTNCGNYVVKIQDWDMNFPQNICYSYLALNLACPSQTFTNLRDMDKSRIHLSAFPNPAKEKLFIKTFETDIYGIKVVDILGRTWMYLNNPESTVNELDISMLPSGAYILEAESKNSRVEYVRFVKQ